MKKTPLSLIIGTGCMVAAPAFATVSIYAEYHLGEAGSLSSNLPQDTSGNGFHFLRQIGTVTQSSASPSAAAFTSTGVASTSYMDTSGGGNNAYYSNQVPGEPNTNTSVATDNFAFGIFARASSTSGTTGTVFSTGGQTSSSYSLNLESGGWEAGTVTAAGAFTNQTGASGSFSANTWVHLAMIRTGGVSTFYVDGVQVGSTFTTAGNHDTGHLSVNPGGNTYFDGNLDEARIVTFTAGESTANIITSLQSGVTAVPEPSTYGLIGAGTIAAAALVRRRREQK